MTLAELRTFLTQDDIRVSVIDRAKGVQECKLYKGPSSKLAMDEIPSEVIAACKQFRRELIGLELGLCPECGQPLETIHAPGIRYDECMNTTLNTSTGKVKACKWRSGFLWQAETVVDEEGKFAYFRDWFKGYSKRVGWANERPR